MGSFFKDLRGINLPWASELLHFDAVRIVLSGCVRNSMFKKSAGSFQAICLLT